MEEATETKEDRKWERGRVRVDCADEKPVWIAAIEEPFGKRSLCGT